MYQPLFTINSRKYDGSLHRTWQCNLIETYHSHYKFIGTFDKEIIHPQIGVIRRGTVSTEYFWLDRWYNIFKFTTPQLDFLGFYCNINLPPVINNNVLDYVDLDLDVFINIEYNFKILDEDEFTENSLKYNYPASLISSSKNALKELCDLIYNREYPFDLPEKTH